MLTCKSGIAVLVVSRDINIKDL